MIPLSAAPNLIDQVYDRVLEAISDNSLLPGEPIRQQDLAEQLGVSRQPVSHALHLLHRQGLVTEIGKKGFQVSLPDPVRIRQLYEVRSTLDGLAAGCASRRIDVDAAGRAALVAALAAGDSICSETPIGHLISLDVDFHHAIYRLAGNPLIEDTLAPQWPHMRRSMASVLALPEASETVWLEHAEIGKLILAGRAEDAEAAARQHALRAGHNVEAGLTNLDMAG